MLDTVSRRRGRSHKIKGMDEEMLKKIRHTKSERSEKKRGDAGKRLKITDWHEQQRQFNVH